MNGIESGEIEPDVAVVAGGYDRYQSEARGVLDRVGANVASVLVAVSAIVRQRSGPGGIADRYRNHIHAVGQRVL